MRALGLLVVRTISGGLLAVHGYAKLFGGEGKGVHPLARQYLGEKPGQDRWIDFIHGLMMTNEFAFVD